MIDETRAQAVRAAIYQAFGDRLKPRAQEIIPRCRTRDFDAEERVRAALAGRNWQSLDTQFVEQWASSCHCYLSPKAYCYYLPALLMPALDPALDISGLPFSMLLSLGADAYALYFWGEDGRLRKRQALLDDAQYEVIGEFLGLFFKCDEPNNQYNYEGYAAAQALYWGWNRLDTPALRAAREYYHRLHHFIYPEPADPQVAALCAEIRTAFADTPYPGDDQLAGSMGADATEIGVEFRGLQWPSVHPRLLAYQYSATILLSDAGLRYFLPAFLMADLLYYDSGALRFTSRTQSRSMNSREAWIPRSSGSPITLLMRNWKR